MAKSKDTDVEVVEVTPSEEAHPTFSVELPRKVISFDQFIALNKQVKPHHVRGFKASIADPAEPRTFAEWLALLQNY